MKALLLLAALALPVNAAVTVIDIQQGAIHTEVVHLDNGNYQYSYTFNHDQVHGLTIWLSDQDTPPPTLTNVQGASYTSSYDPHPGEMDWLRWWGQETIETITFESPFAPEATGQARLYYMGVLGDLPGRFPTLDIVNNFNVPTSVPEPSLTLLGLLGAIPFLKRRR